MSKDNQSPVNLTYRLNSLTRSLEHLETQPQAGTENEARRLVSLLRASSEFRGMDDLLNSARLAEQAPSATFPDKLRDLIYEIKQALEQSPHNTGIVLIVSSDSLYATRLSECLNELQHETLIANSPQKANSFIADSTVAFCIVDLVLADLDGRAFINTLRNRTETAALPVVAITPSPSETNFKPPLPVSGADVIFFKNSALEDIANYLTIRLKRSHIRGLQARRDPVTGLPNRAACHEIFRHLQRSIQKNDAMAFILIGINHFAAIANRCTPLACDELTRRIGATLSSSLRATDVVARWNESEFAVLLTGEDHFGATKAVEKALMNLVDLTIKTPEDENISVTTCAGITINNAQTSIEDATLRAESHLYMAFSDVDSPDGGKRIVSDAIPIIHQEEPVALCMTNTGMAKIIKQILERETFRVEIFPDTESVFARITQHPFSLLILDDELPHEGGFHLLQQMNEQANTNTIGTMMMISKEASIERIIKLGANDYFLKPPTMPAFLSQIRRVINHTSHQHSSPGITIMVADHELPQLLLAGTTLHQLGTCQVLLAKGAADALQRLKNAHPEYLILDALMPHISTAEFITQIGHMEWLKNTKIILSTENPAAPIPFPVQHPILGTISRPYKPGTLLEELHNLIPTLPKSIKGRMNTDPRLLELEVQRILSLKA